MSIKKLVADRAAKQEERKRVADSIESFKAEAEAIKSRKGKLSQLQDDRKALLADAVLIGKASDTKAIDASIKAAQTEAAGDADRLEGLAGAIDRLQSQLDEIDAHLEGQEDEILKACRADVQGRFETSEAKITKLLTSLEAEFAKIHGAALAYTSFGGSNALLVHRAQNIGGLIMSAPYLRNVSLGQSERGEILQSIREAGVSC